MLRAALSKARPLLARASESCDGRALPLLAAGTTVAAATFTVALADDSVMHPVVQSWDHLGYLSCYDASSLRRGHQVYAQVCASCHGLSHIAYRNLVNVCYSELEAKDMT